MIGLDWMITGLCTLRFLTVCTKCMRMGLYIINLAFVLLPDVANLKFFFTCKKQIEICNLNHKTGILLNTQQ